MAARDWLFALAAVGVVLVLALYGFPAYRIAAPDRGGAVLTPDIGKRESPTVSPQPSPDIGQRENPSNAELDEAGNAVDFDSSWTDDAASAVDSADAAASTDADAADAGTNAPCPEADNELLPPAICAAYAQLKPALAGFNAPAEISLGDSVPIRFVIARNAAARAPAEALKNLPGAAEEFTVQTSRYVRAELIARSPGLTVEARTPARQDLLSRPEIAWDWDVTAVHGGQQRLTLRISAELATDRSGKLWETSEDRQINVVVPLDTRATNLFQRLLPVLQDARLVVLAIVALLGALGALWLAFRHFGKPGQG